MNPVNVAILGCGGFAREVFWALGCGHVHPTGARLHVVGFVDREPHPAGFYGLPVWTLETVPRDVRLICGIGGMPEIKQRIVDDAQRAGFRCAPPVVFDGVPIGPNVRIGEGSIVCAGSILTVDITVGRHVAINLDCTIGHDSDIGDYATLSPGTHMSGHVTFGRGAYAGTGCSVIEGLRVGDYAVIGAGAVVTREVPDQALVVGVPAAIKKQPRALVVPVPGREPVAAVASEEHRP